MSTFERVAQEILTKTYVIEQKRTVGNHRRTWFTAGLRELHFAKLPASFTASGTNTAVTTAVSRTRQHALAALCRTAGVGRPGGPGTGHLRPVTLIGWTTGMRRTSGLHCQQSIICKSWKTASTRFGGASSQSVVTWRTNA